MNIKYRMGWRVCPSCGKFARIAWVKDWVMHPDEPPLFWHYECTACGAATDIMPSVLSEKAVRGLGFENFDKFAEEVILPLKERDNG